MTFRLTPGPFALGYAALAKGLYHLGVDDVEVVHLNEPSNGQPIIAFPPHVKTKVLSSTRSRWAPLAIANYIKHRQPDLLISMPVQMNVAAVAGWMLAKPKRGKLLVSERATLSYQVYECHPHHPVWLMMPPLVKLLYPHASGVVCNSTDVKTDLQERIHLNLPSEQIAVIAPAVDACMVVERMDQTPPHVWLQNKELPVLACIARLHQQKNLPLLLASFAQVQKIVPSRLLILGEGPQRAMLLKQVNQLQLSDAVDLPGHVENPWAYLRYCDGFVLTSTEEAFGRVLVEAMACGLPVIATDALGGGPRTILDGGRYGILTPPNDAGAVAAAMVKLLQDADLCVRLQQAGKVRATMFDPVVVARQWLDFAQALEAPT